MSDRHATPGPRLAPEAPAGPARSATKAEAAARDFAMEAARALSDDKCHDIVVMDVRALSQVTDFIVVGSGTSDRQIRSAIKNVEAMGLQRGFPAFRTDADDRASWLLADFVDVIVHVFEPNTRAHYDLEMLWGDAPRVEWERAGRRSRIPGLQAD
jgi:ribosome-associated protein